MKNFLRLTASFVIAFITLILLPITAKAGFSLYGIAWFYPGKVIAPLIANLVPQSWVFGDPTSDTYWPQVSATGFAILCAYVWWGSVIFMIWKSVSLRNRRVTALKDKKSDKTEE